MDVDKVISKCDGKNSTSVLLPNKSEKELNMLVRLASDVIAISQMFVYGDQVGNLEHRTFD